MAVVSNELQPFFVPQYEEEIGKYNFHGLHFLSVVSDK